MIVDSLAMPTTNITQSSELRLQPTQAQFKQGAGEEKERRHLRPLLTVNSNSNSNGNGSSYLKGQQ